MRLLNLFVIACCSYYRINGARLSSDAGRCAIGSNQTCTYRAQPALPSSAIASMRLSSGRLLVPLQPQSAALLPHPGCYRCKFRTAISWIWTRDDLVTGTLASAGIGAARLTRACANLRLLAAARFSGKHGLVSAILGLMPSLGRNGAEETISRLWQEWPVRAVHGVFGERPVTSAAYAAASPRTVSVGRRATDGQEHVGLHPVCAVQAMDGAGAL
jgi:hypothetical protein